MPGVIGRIPAILERFRHAASAWLEELSALEKYHHEALEADQPVPFLYDGHSQRASYKSNPNPHPHPSPNPNPCPSSICNLPDHQARIDSALQKVVYQLNLLISNISWIRDDLHGDLQLIRSNYDLLSSQSTESMAQKRQLHTHCGAIDEMEVSDNYALSTPHQHVMSTASNASPFNTSNPSSPSSTITNTTTTSCGSIPETDCILSAQQKQSMQYTVAILQKFIDSNSAMVSCIQQNQSRLDKLWVDNHVNRLRHSSHLPPLHRLHSGWYRSVYICSPLRVYNSCAVRPLRSIYIFYIFFDFVS